MLYGERFTLPGFQSLTWAEGIYLVLFILAIHTIARRKKAGKKLLLGYAWTMAVFGTVQLVIRLVDTVLIACCVEILVKQDGFTSQPKLAKLALLSRSLETAQTVNLAGNKYVDSVSLPLQL